MWIKLLLVVLILSNLAWFGVYRIVERPVNRIWFGDTNASSRWISGKIKLRS